MVEYRDTLKYMPKNKKQTSVVMRTSIMQRVITQSIAVTTLTAVILSLSAFTAAQILIKQRVYSQLSSIATAKEEYIAHRINTDRELTALLASGETIRAMVQHSSGNEELKSILERMQKDGISVLGMRVFSSNSSVIASTGVSVEPYSKPISATTTIPSEDTEGWDGYTVYSPISIAGTQGVLGVQFSLKAFLQSVLAVPSLGNTGEVSLGQKRGEELLLLNNEYAPGKRSPLSLGSFAEKELAKDPMALAIAQGENVGSSVDYKGNTVFAAYRSLPLLGWGLVVSMHQKEAMSGMWDMAMSLALKSVLLLVVASMAAVFLSKKLTAPLRHLTKKMSILGPDHWTLGRTIKTGDEVEVLERIAADMAKRLKGLYDSLEEEVENRTRELEDQYRKDHLILNTIDYGVMMINIDGRITDANPAALQALQCSSNTCIGLNAKEALDIRLHHKKMRGKKHPIVSVLEKGISVRSLPDKHYSIMRSDNILIPVSLVIKPLMDRKKILGAIIVFQDVTEQRKVDYLKSEFISLASHQLRTPLSTLQWYIELLNTEGKVSKEQQEYVNEMTIAAKRMSNLIDSLLHAARLEGGDITPHNNTVDLTAIIADLGEELRALGKEKKIACTIKVPHKKEEIVTDSVLLHVIFKNLFSNAIKYTLPGGSVQVEMKSAKDHVKISVSDTGIGIPKSDQKRLFERLFRAKNVRKMDTDGNGLGLYITKMIVESLGGSVTCKSIENKGSTFTVKLPIKSAKQVSTKQKEEGEI